MPEVEGVGELATGAALARAVEPRTGEADGHTHEANCLNCGEPLTGAYCSRCGQRGHVHRTIGAWWHDFLHSVLHVDGKFWATVRLLVWKPGELTRRYVHGERARFVSPTAVFLFTVFLMFAVFSVTGSSLIGDPTAVGDELVSEIDASEAEVAALERQRAQRIAARRSTQEVDRRLAGAREDLRALRRLGQTGILSTGSENVENPLELDLSGAPGPLAFFDEAYRKAKQNPSLLFYKLQANAYKFSWALIPMSVPFVWVLFLHRKRYRRDFTGYDHLVFVTYSIAFMSIALVAIVLVDATGTDSPLPGLIFMAVPPIHMYRQLRGAYGLSPLSAIWRTVALMLFAGMALTLFFLLLLAIGVFG